MPRWILDVVIVGTAGLGFGICFGVCVGLISAAIAGLAVLLIGGQGR